MNFHPLEARLARVR